MGFILKSNYRSLSRVKRVTLYLRSLFPMMYPEGPQVYTQCFPEKFEGGGGGAGGGPNSSKMASYFLKPIMQDGSWLCQTCLVPFISQYLF